MSRLLHRSLAAPPARVVHGDGIVLITDDGRQILDGAGGAAVACLGHGHPEVLAAMQRQASQIAYAHTGYFTTDAAEELAERLVGPQSVAGRVGLTHAFFVSSGSEATEAALKLARQYFVEIGESDRTQFISRRQGYHGNTLGALGVSGNAARRAPYEPILGTPVDLVSPCFAYRGQRLEESAEAYGLRLADELDEAFMRAGPGRVAAFLAETVVGATTGCVPPVPGYFAAVRDVCDRHGALLILDEVMCGMGRCGTLHAWEAEGVVPDIQVVAKGLAGGYQPIGGLLVAGRVTKRLYNGSGVFVHGQTYQAHPVACAAALAVQQVIERDDLPARVADLGFELAKGLRAALGQHPHVGDIRGRGLFWAVEIVADRDQKTPFSPDRRVHAQIGAAALQRGLAVYPMGGTVDGRAGDHVVIAPPYICTRAQIADITERFAASVGDVVG